MPSHNKELFDRAKAKHFHVLGRLREKFPSAVSFDEALGFAFTIVERQDDALVKAFRAIMRNSGEVVIENEGRMYRYKPPFAIRNSEDLIEYFQKQTHTRSMAVDDLKKGWIDCDDQIDELEKEHKLMVIRAKKDNAPKYIWADDPALSAPVDSEFVNLWDAIKLPENDEVIRALEQANRTPAGQVAIQNAVQAKGKTRKMRQSTKKTNTHMSAIFKDFSSLRQKGK